jgi:Family of unknown function (DUF6353)
MKFAELNGLIRSNVKEHSSIILTVMAGVGVATTAYLAHRAGVKTTKTMEKHRTLDRKNNFKLIWKNYVPVTVSAATTVACIVGANRIETRKLLAVNAALDASQRAFVAYSDKVIEEFGTRKDESIRNKMAIERVNEDPPCSGDVILGGQGNVLCCELFTMRYFMSDMELLRRAVNSVNEKVLKHDYATLDDFYYLIHLRSTSYSGHIGWKSDRLLELTYTAVLTEDDRPCIAFEYNYTKPI